MKTEELLRYEAEYRVMGEAFGTFLLVFDFPKLERIENLSQSILTSKEENLTVNPVTRQQV